MIWAFDDQTSDICSQCTAYYRWHCRQQHTLAQLQPRSWNVLGTKAVQDHLYLATASLAYGTTVTHATLILRSFDTAKTLHSLSVSLQITPLC